MATIRNPILPGFNPDPSILRVGEDFYVANSTFEWFPGVQIHHSRDLVHWRLLTRPLDRVSQLDMAGNPDSGGIWAPQLSFADGKFWLIYTDVKSLSGAFKDTPNYLVTAEQITGPWSDPVYLNASGFDPSLFHDPDTGRKWLVNMIWDHRPGRDRFGGIVLQEYDAEARRLVGPIRNIFRGSELGITEGPHLMRKGGWYYLITAEGGTGPEHAVTVARSRRLEGPYEIDPDNPLLTARDRPDAPLAKAGHGWLTDTPSGELYLVHLCARPGKAGRCMLGRETAIQKVHWTEDGWLRLSGGDNIPRQEVPAPDLPSCPWPDRPVRDEFNDPELPIAYQSLRVPVQASWLSLAERPGWVRLRGRQSLCSRHYQSLIARRVTSWRCRAATRVDFAPETFQQMAGLVAYYNTRNWAYLRISHDEQLGRCLGVAVCDNGRYDELLGCDIQLPGNGAVELRLTIDGEAGQFYWAPDGGDWQGIGPQWDASKLSDEYVEGWGFTGAMVGICCQDLSGQFQPADFDWFEYETL